MRCAATALLLGTTLLCSCAGSPDRRTLAQLHDVEPDMSEVQVHDGLGQAMRAYESFLEEAPESELTPEAMRRLADLKLEQEFGILGDGGSTELPAPRRAAATAGTSAPSAAIPGASASDPDFERRMAGQEAALSPDEGPALELPEGGPATARGPEQAIALYDRILSSYPDYEHNDQVLYQKARAFDELGRPDEAIAVIERLVAEHPGSRYVDEVQFRRAEYFFVRRKYLAAEEAYAAIAAMGPGSEYYELALYKLGWTLYKQELHEEALTRYMALLDYKVSTGYDFDAPADEADGQRIADTFRVISLSFSNLGGSGAVAEYFAASGPRSYEDRVYSQLGEFYLEKLRYADAAEVYGKFIELHPLHRASPHFSMRVVEIYEAGGFPKLVLEAKKEFAASYGLQAEYWRHFDVEDSPEVLSYLKSNLSDLATHYHALYQDGELADEAPANFEEALRWYRAYLASFPAEADTPGVHHRLADLLLEHEDFAEAARAYEHTAYEYPAHEQAAEAGYAAIYAHRENQKRAPEAEEPAARRAAVTSTLRFVEAFPEHEHAAVVLGAAIDDLYAMQDLEPAIATGRKLIDEYPDAEPSVRRSAWTVVAHASLDLGRYPEAEAAYLRVLETPPAEDESRQGIVDNLAAAVYQQGEQARLAQDYRAAADHFLRIREVAPTSEIRPKAEYDAGAALIELAEWTEAGAVLDSFRQSYPEHQLSQEATKQMAVVYRQEGEGARAAAEYERMAAEADDPELRGEALLLAGELYEDSKLPERALAVYQEYLRDFPRPLELAVETRFKVAALHEAAGDAGSRHEQLRRIVEIDAAAGPERSDRTRELAARSALVLAEELHRRFAEIELVQPFERNLQEKRRRMDEALGAFGRLVDYEVGEVIAAATFYMAEIYSEFGRALLDSERPKNLDAASLEEYEAVLEEEAFPFEEKAIAVHEKNLELMAAGIYGAWIQKSLDRLAELVPGRYAKFETSSGFIASIDHYAYRQTPAAEEVSDAALR